MLDVHVDRGGFCRGSDGPAGFDGVSARIERYDFVFVFDVVVDHSLAIGYGVFRPAAHGNGGDYGQRTGIDDGGVASFTVHREDVLGGGIVNDAVRVATGFNVAGDFEGLQIEDDGFVRTSVADEAAAQIADQGDAMNSLEIGDAADDRTAIGVDDLNFRIVRDVEAVGRRIESDVVPILLAAGRCPEIIFVEKVVSTLRNTSERDAPEKQHNGTDREST